MFLILYHEKSVAEKLSSVITAFRVSSRQQFSIVCTPIDVRNDVKKSFEHFDVISMVDKDKDHGKLLSICFFNNIDSFDVHLR